VVGLWCEPGWVDRLVLLLIATFASFQAGLLAHDVSHRNLSKSRVRTRLLGQYFMSFLGGQAYAHWEWQHLSHHRHTQEAADDPDLDVDFFALTHQAASGKRGLRRWTTRQQGWLLWPMVTLQGFAVRVNTVRFLIQNRRTTRLDAAGFCLHLMLWLALPCFFLGPVPALINYLLTTWMIGPCLAGSFIWNHVGAESFDHSPARAYAAQRVLGSRNLEANGLYTFLFGALNFHVEHHLAPHVPASRLPQVRPLLDEVLGRVGIRVEVSSYWRAMDEVRRHVAAVAREMDP
jgi:fatty acid desaturase